MADTRFAAVPNISIPRSRFKQPFNHSFSMKHGDLVPADCFEILPGDTYKIDMSSLIWMSNPIRPIFGNITGHVDVFFVPMRLVWKYTKEFFGENNTTAGYQTTSYTIPSVKLGYHVSGNVFEVEDGSLSQYLGKPICENLTETNTVPVSILKERAYYLIWSTYYRSQQLQAPFLMVEDGNGTYATNVTSFIGSIGGTQKKLVDGLMQVNKEFDYFTAATLYPQYGPAVSLPLGTYANVITLDTDIASSAFKAPLHLSSRDNTPVGYAGKLGSSQTYSGSQTYSMKVADDTDFASAAGNIVVPKNLYADLSNATAATINQLRYSFAVQKYLERANFGSRFFEMLQVHYGVTSPDASLQIPQRIGHADFRINVSTVLSTAGATDDTSTALGMPGATSCTGTKKYLCTHAFTEPGYLFVMLSTTHERSYSQGILREDLRKERYEIYSPEFANLGDQEILNCEIFYGNDTYNKGVFGYQEHWAEYRYRPHRVSGKLDPQATSALDFWVLTDDYSSRPALDGSWIVEDRDELARCLVSGSTGPDYIVDCYFDNIATREMPLFTIPGLIDHFGVR